RAAAAPWWAARAPRAPLALGAGGRRRRIHLVSLGTEVAEAAGAIVRQRVRRVERACVQPHAPGAELPCFLHRVREQGSAQSATDEGRSQTKVRQLDLLITAAAQLEVAGALIADEQFPDRDIGRREVRTKCVVIPCEPVVPVPGPTDGRMDTPIVSEWGRMATHDAR